MQEELNTELMSMVLNWTAGQSLIPYLECAGCAEVFNQPMRLPCGHTLCKKCLPSDSHLCLECQLPYNPAQVSKDLLASNIIEDLTLSCDYGDCKWTGEFSQYKKHLKRVHLMNPDLGESNSTILNIKPLKMGATNDGKFTEKKGGNQAKIESSSKPLKIARGQSSKAPVANRKSSTEGGRQK